MGTKPVPFQPTFFATSEIFFLFLPDLRPATYDLPHLPTLSYFGPHLSLPGAILSLTRAILSLPGAILSLDQANLSLPEAKRSLKQAILSLPKRHLLSPGGELLLSVEGVSSATCQVSGLNRRRGRGRFP